MFFQALYEGVINGAILAMIAMGIALVWGVMNILSFCQGEFMMIAMFVTYYLNIVLGLDPLVSLPITMAFMAVFGFLIYRTVIAKALKGPVLSQRLVTFALSMLLINVALMLFSGQYKTIPKMMISGNIDLGFVVIANSKLVPFAIAIVITVALFLFMNKTKVGKSIRATAMDKRAAELVGINSDRTFALAYALSAAIAGAAGCGLSYYYYVYPQVGTNFQLFGFIAVVMGGLGNIGGAFVGGLIMGVADSFTGVYLDTAYKYVGIIVVFLIILQFKPKGLFGGK